MDPNEAATMDDAIAQLRRDREARSASIRAEWESMAQEDLQEELLRNPPAEEATTEEPVMKDGAAPEQSNPWYHLGAEGPQASFIESAKAVGTERFRALSAAGRESVSDPIDAAGDALAALTRTMGGEGSGLEQAAEGAGEAVDSALKQVPGLGGEPQTGAGEFFSEAGQFGGAVKGAIKGLQFMKVLNRWSKTQAAVAGGVADFVAGDPQGRVSDLANELGIPMPESLLTNPDDTDFEGRLKNMKEGAALGVFADVFGTIVSGARQRTMIRQAADAADDVADKGAVSELGGVVEAAQAARERLATIRAVHEAIGQIVDEGSTELSKLKDIAEFKAGAAGDTVDNVLATLDANASSRQAVLQQLNDYRDGELARALTEAEAQAGGARAAMVDAFGKSKNVPASVLEAYRRAWKDGEFVKGDPDAKMADQQMGEAATRAAEQLDPFAKKVPKDDATRAALESIFPGQVDDKTVYWVFSHADDKRVLSIQNGNGMRPAVELTPDGKGFIQKDLSNPDAATVVPLPKELVYSPEQLQIKPPQTAPAERIKVGKLKVSEADSKAFLLSKLKGNLDGMAEAIVNTVRANGKVVGVDNFDTFAAPDGIKDLIAGVEQQFDDKLLGTRTFDQTKSEAYKLIKSDLVADGLDLEAAARVANEFAQKTKNLDAYYQAVKVTELVLAKRVDDFVEGAIQGNKLDLAEFHRWFQLFAEFNNVRMTGRGQIGRAFGSMRIKTSSRRFAGLVDKNGRKVFTDADAIVDAAGGADNVTKLAQAWKIHAKDTLGRRHFTRNRAKAGKEFGYAALEAYRANRLASLRSIARNALGGVITTGDLALNNMAVDFAANVRANRWSLNPILDNLNGFVAGTRQAIIGNADMMDLLRRPGQTIAGGSIGQAVRTGVSPTVNTRAAFVEGRRRAISSEAFRERYHRYQSQGIAGRAAGLQPLAKFLGGQNARFTIPQGFQFGRPGSRVAQFTARVAGRQFGLGAVLADAMGSVQQLSFLGQQVPDEFIKSINYAARLRVSARRAAHGLGKEGPDAAMYVEQVLNDIDNIDFLIENGSRSDDYLQEIALIKSRAQDQAANATFSDDYNMSSTTKSIEHILNSHPTARLVVPFSRTPARIQSFIFMDRTPLGLLSGPEGRLWSDLRSPDAETKALAWSKLTLGSSMAALASYMALEGNLTGVLSTDNMTAGQMELFGQKKQFAIVTKNDDGTVTYTQPTGALEPYENLFFTMASFHEIAAHLEADEADEYATAIGLALAANIQSRTYFEGISRAIRDFDRAVQDGDPTAFVRGQTASIATGFFPAPLGALQSDLRDNRNPVQANTVAVEAVRGPDGELRIYQEPSLGVETANRIASRTPEAYRDALVPVLEAIVRKKIELEQQPLLNFWAQEVKTPPGIGPDNMSPFLTTTVTPDELSQKMIDLGIGTNLKAEFGRIPAGDDAIDLTAAQVNDYKRLTNQFGTDNPNELRERLTFLLLHEQLTDPAPNTKLRGSRKDEVAQVISDAKAVAREKLFDKYPELEMIVRQKERNANDAKNPRLRDKAIEKDKAGTIDPDLERVYKPEIEKLFQALE